MEVSEGFLYRASPYIVDSQLVFLKRNHVYSLSSETVLRKPDMVYYNPLARPTFSLGNAARIRVVERVFPRCEDSRNVQPLIKNGAKKVNSKLQRRE